jgi:hypothetical protein
MLEKFKNWGIFFSIRAKCVRDRRDFYWPLWTTVECPKKFVRNEEALRSNLWRMWGDTE